jgi:hypothetical protein
VDITVSKTLEAKLRNMQADLEKHIVAQDVKLDQAGERLQAEMQREKGAGTIPGSGETARNMKADLEKYIVAQNVKMDQAGERLQAEIVRSQREKGAGTIPGSDETAENQP